MPLAPSARRALVALAVAAPVFSIASLAGAALWVRAHGGLASSLAHLARETAFLAGRVGGVPAALADARMAALDQRLAALDRVRERTGGTWVSMSGDDDGDDLSFAIIEPGERGSFSFNTNGDSRSGELSRLRRSADAPTVWFSRDGAEYVITDPATVKRAGELCAPLREIGAEMGKVGAAQGRIGMRLGRYGGRLGALGGRLGAASARLATMRVSDGERARLEAEMESVRAEMERLSAEMETAGRDQSGDREDLSRRMEELSKRHQDEMKKVRAGIRSLIDEAIRTGKAQSLGRSI